MRPITITIARQHIEAGQRHSTDHCPIALALKQALLTPYVSVGPVVMTINGATWELDPNERKWLERFDEGKRVRPFKIVLAR